jgi:quercetin dioxygenase-like cupin family protein
MADEGAEEARVVDLIERAAASATPGPAWAYQGADLNANLLVFDDGDGVAEHVNAEVDVLVVVLAGAGVVEVDGRAFAVRAGQALVVSKGARRALRADGGRFAYLTCHRRRAGLWPAGLPRPAAP